MPRAPTTRPYGLWKSRITPSSMGQALRLGDVQWVPSSAATQAAGKETLVWWEGHAHRANLMVRSGHDAPRILSTHARARLGYGGGDFGVGPDCVVFADAKSGRLMHLPLPAPSGSARPLTPPFGAAASPVVSADGKFVVYVHEDDGEVARIAVVDAKGRGWPGILTEGRSFYAQPALSPDGAWLAFVAWDEPKMPWDASTLYLLPLQKAGGNATAEGMAVSLPRPSALPRAIAGAGVSGNAESAVFQPTFAADGRTLYYVDDAAGFGQIYAYDLASSTKRLVTRDEVEHGMPNWVQGMRSFVPSRDGLALFACINHHSRIELARIDLASGTSKILSGLEEYGSLGQPSLSASGDRLAFVASGGQIPPRLVSFDIASSSSTVLVRSSSESEPTRALSRPEVLSWPTAKGQTAHGIYYPPVHEECVAEGAPPVVMIVHGGPTAQMLVGWREEAQFLASRGYGVLYVNHRGSTGYGRAYMKALDGQWGVVDVEDCVSALGFLAQTGRAHPERVAIMGGSAGGYTALMAMIQHPTSFAAAIVQYGVTDHFASALDTHRFERSYNDVLLGPLPDAAAIWRDRSPTTHAHKIKRPLAFFQGDQDKVVTKDQADMLMKAMQRGGAPVSYHVYQGEGHGFRKPENVEHMWKTISGFLARHVVFA